VQAAYRVEARRGSTGVLEAAHRVTVVAWDGDLEERARRAAPGVLLSLGAFPTCFRSGSKPFQLLPLVERGHAERLGLGDRELAVAAASHNGDAEHREAVRSLLRAVGATEAHLLCGYHPPRDEASLADLLRSGRAPSPIYNNCSGKHAAMLALAAAEGWPLAEYTEFTHPVQRACVQAVCEVCGADPAEVPLVVDGCSAANPALPLADMARGFHRFATAREGAGDGRQRALARIRRAMAAEPHLVAGTARICTEVIRATRGRVIPKTGAEGLLCAALPDAGVGVALKVEDGADRAKGPALLAFLVENGWISDAERAALAAWEHPPVTNVRGKEVGRLEWKAEHIPALA
jgi:L-asparaginase II